MKKTLYQILEVAPDASADAIRESYQGLRARHESALGPGNDDAANRLKFLKHAHDVLSDPNQRSAYDASLQSVPATEAIVHSDPVPQSIYQWRRWFIGGSVALLLVVSGSIVVGYLRWKPTPKPSAAVATRSPIVVTLPQTGPVGRPDAAPRERDAATDASAKSQDSAPAKEVASGESAPPGAPAVTLSAEKIFDRHSRSIVVVLGFDGANRQVIQASGVVTEPQRVITNCHVVRDAEVLKIWQASRTHAARLEFGDVDSTRDLCQLLVPDLESPSVTLGSSKNLRIGRRVYALGAPLGLDLTLSEGIVSGLRTHQNAAYVQVTAAISPGSSGGALFDENGELVGITTFGALIGQNINFAVPVEWIKELPSRPRTPFISRSKP